MSLQDRQTLRRRLADESLQLTHESASALARVWELWARDEQTEPDGEWRTWYVRGGRGSGKTRTGSETLANWIRPTIDDGDLGDWAVIAPTFSDARDVCMEGPSGLFRALGGNGGGVIRPGGWNRSHGELYLANGSRVYLDGANDGAYRVQGKNLRGAWCDEVGLWALLRWQEAWNESLTFAVRLAPGKVIATGTPKQGHPLVKALLDDEHVQVTTMRMVDNIANLSEATVHALRAKWAGTRRGRQELDGEYLEDVPGALWTLAQIDQCRVDGAPEDLARVVVGVDPSGSADADTGTSETGIVGCGYSQHFDRGYVLADVSCHASPETWGRKVVGLYRSLKADLVVAERNFGGEMVRATIHAVDRNVPVRLVTASRGKVLRAEPVSALYEQGRVHHVRVHNGAPVALGELEAQMTTWAPNMGLPSPDRLDALVWAVSELMVTGSQVTQSPAYGDHTDPVVRRGDLTLVGERYVDQT